MKRTLLIWLMALGAAAAVAQAVEISRFERIRDRDGLSQNTVRCIMQDSRGFVWLGTINGLNRYNGKEFKVMQPQQGEFASLTDNRIRSMTEDRHGFLWIRTTADTYCCYDSNTERFIDYDPTNPRKYFTRLLLFDNDDVWLRSSSGDGCCRVRHNPDGSLVSKRFLERDFGTNSILFIIDAADNKVIIGTDKGVFRLDNDEPVKIIDKSYAYAFESDNQVFMVTNQGVDVLEAGSQAVTEQFEYKHNIELNTASMTPDGKILLADRDEIIVFDTKTKRFIPSAQLFGEANISNAGFYADNEGKIWVFNKTGVIRGQISGDKYEKITVIPPEVLPSIDAERYEVFRDSRGIIWITTYGNGLFAIEKNGETQRFCHADSDLPTDFLLSITEDRSGEIWVGTELAGACKISLSNYPVRVVSPAPLDAGNRANSVRLLYKDRQGRLWLGTRDNRLHVCDTLFNPLYTLPVEGGAPFCMTEDSAGNLFTGIRGGGITVYHPDGKTVKRRIKLPTTRNVGSNNIYSLAIDAQNRLWAASFGGGLFYSDLNAATPKNAASPDNAAPPTNALTAADFHNIFFDVHNHNAVRHIHHDAEGWLWAGSNAGVIAFKPDEIIADKARFINFHFSISDANSLSNNEVKYIFEDSRRRLWFGTTGGGLNLLVRQTPLENSYFKRYSTENGLSNTVIQSITEDLDGNIWVSTEGGSGISKFNLQTELFENYNFTSDKQDCLFNETASLRMDNGALVFGAYSGAYVFNPTEIRHDDYNPPVILTMLSVNGTEARPGDAQSPLNKSITNTDKIVLRYNRNSFNIEFAMLNFHSPDYNQYTYFLEGYEETWNPITRYNIASYRNVPAGTYTFKVKGCNSFGVWAESETRLQIVVTPPFWKSYWAYPVYLLTFCLLAVAAASIIRKFNRLHNAVEIERQLTEYKLRFFTNISHEFRTPLTIIKGSVDNLMAMKMLPQAVVQQVNQMSKSTARLMRLIDQLLMFRKIRNGKMELHTENADAVAFFRDIFHSFDDLAGRKHIDFQFLTDMQEFIAPIDKNICDKVAYNFLSNAIKHTPENGRVAMSLQFAKDMLTVCVDDSGAGVPPDKRSSLFVRFAQLDASIGGTGVGLHLSAELAALHKGSLAYEDSAALGGARFVFKIPLTEETGDAASVKQYETTDYEGETYPGMPEEVQVNRLRYCKILVIEDDDEMRAFITSQLSGSFTVLTAKDGAEGLEKAAAEEPDIIVCDVLMPVMDGFEATRRLKDNFDTCHIPVILLTACTTEDQQIEGINAGADSYITKPFSARYLTARIVKMLEQREKLRLKYSQQPGLTPEVSLTTTDRDREFLDKLHALMEENIANEEFTPDDYASATCMSRSAFYRKVKGITGHSPNEYINIVRMKKAAALLVTTDLKINEISFAVGVNDPLYFSRLFKSQFALPPKQYRAQHH